MAQRRTRSNRLPRDEIRIRKSWLGEHVGKDTMKETCPRCGWPCTHLVRSYYESPWNEWGGKCSACIVEAVRVYEDKGWPPDPHEVKEPEEKQEASSPVPLFDQ